MPRRKTEETNLLGEPVKEPEPKQAQGTLYTVFERAELERPGRGELVFAWIDRGAARATNGRAAITEVVGDHAGAFLAVPESSAKPHVRREERKLVWSEDGELPSSTSNLIDGNGVTGQSEWTGRWGSFVPVEGVGVVDRGDSRSIAREAAARADDEELPVAASTASEDYPDGDSRVLSQAEADSLGATGDWGEEF